MPVPPIPMTFSCPKCGWSKTISPRSDALGATDFITTCPKCENMELQLVRGNHIGNDDSRRT